MGKNEPDEQNRLTEGSDAHTAEDGGQEDESDVGAPRHSASKPQGRNGAMRSKTMSLKEMSRDLRRRRQLGIPDDNDDELFRAIEKFRPRRRADCVASARPCLFISCKHHLYLDVNPATGSIKLNFPDKEVWELKETCALDVADKGGITLEEVGDIMNLTRERIRQVETRGLLKLREAAEEELDPNDPEKKPSGKR